MLRESSPYSAAITREQFLYYEMRTAARLFCEGLTEREIIDRIEQEIFPHAQHVVLMKL